MPNPERIAGLVHPELLGRFGERAPSPTPLLDAVLDAHGGMEHWRRTATMRARLVLHGPLWASRGWPDGFELGVRLETQRERVEIVQPDRVAAFDQEMTRRDAIQMASFESAANWSCLTAPFGFTHPGVRVSEIEPWQEDGEIWRRLAVRFPSSDANDNGGHVFYFDSDCMLRRMDYAPVITGGPLISHYTYRPALFCGFIFPTRRRVHLRDADGIADKELAVITIDVGEVMVR